MKKFSILLVFTAISSITLWADVPAPIVTDSSVRSGHATLAGRLNAIPNGPVGISIRNGNLVYSTITDSDGRWAIVFQQRSTSYNVQAWNLSDTSDRSVNLVAEVRE